MNLYLTIDEIVEIHQTLIAEFGGSPGLRDIRRLESALMRPQSGYYQSIIEEAAALMESLANNHPFIDGNKRIAFFATDIFLRLNDYFIKCDGKEAYSFFMVLFNSNSFNYSNLLKWLRDKINPL